MAVEIVFNGRKITEPGIYGRVVSGIAPKPQQISFGDVLIIDSGKFGAGFGGLAGINGTGAKGKKAIYEFNDGQDFRNFVKGGVLYDASRYLFSPSRDFSGSFKLYYVRACTTAPASLVSTFASGNFTIKTRDEGLNANGAIEATLANKLIKGYALKWVKGTDVTKYKIQFFVGTYRGADANGRDYELDKANSNPTLLIETPDFTTIAEVLPFFRDNYYFNLYFELGTNTITTAPGTITGAEFLALENVQTLFAGATEVYNALDYTNALSAIVDNQAQFILSDLYGGTDGKSTKATDLLNFVNNNADYKKIIVMGGGNDSTQFDVVPTGSIQIAQFYNSERVVVVHGGVEVQKFDGQTVTRDTFYHSAMVCGLLGTLTPQTPATFKTIDIVGVQHDMTKTEREKALKYGVLHNRYKTDLGYVVNQAINTLQKNDTLIDVRGVSYEISIMRIIDQINKEISLEAEKIFVGGNLFTASAEDIKLFVEGFLQNRTLTGSTDGLLKSFGKITVSLFEDSWFVNYEIKVNSPINKIFFTGIILSNNS
jgi:hypothetical protein